MDSKAVWIARSEQTKDYKTRSNEVVVLSASFLPPLIITPALWLVTWVMCSHDLQSLLALQCTDAYEDVTICFLLALRKHHDVRSYYGIFLTQFSINWIQFHRYVSLCLWWCLYECVWPTAIHANTNAISLSYAFHFDHNLALCAKGRHTFTNT